MYRLKSRLVALSLGVLCLSAHALDVGQSLPSFNWEKMGGGGLSPADLKGSVVYVDFWASWCGPCKHSFPWMNDMQAKYGDKGLKIIAVNLDQKMADAQAFLKGTPASFTVAFDSKGESPRKFGVKGMPSSYLVGPDGRVVLVHSGFRHDDGAELEALIQDALKGAGGSK
ncbi:thiol:disulfide interchange protein DsbE [Aquabacterium sp. NJ1]|nr:thiol:disulfide interchange protein DsbE [Aquabacterium sp. NJ1]